MHTEWNLHLLRVVIDDGEPERHIDDVFSWPAICFWTDTVMQRSINCTKQASLADHYSYWVNAEVVYVSEDHIYPSCVIDFGIKAISESGSLIGMPLPIGCKAGDFVCGLIRLELPLCTDVHPCKLTYQWYVNRVIADLADFSIHPGDLGRTNYMPVPGTDAVEAGSYILCCSDQTEP